MPGIEVPLGDRLWALFTGRSHPETDGKFPAGKAPNKGWSPNQIGFHAAIRYHEHGERAPIIDWLDRQRREWMFDEILSIIYEPFYLLEVLDVLGQARLRRDSEVIWLCERWLSIYFLLVSLHDSEKGTFAPGWRSSPQGEHRDMALAVMRGQSPGKKFAKRYPDREPYYRGVTALLALGVTADKLPTVLVTDVRLRAPLHYHISRGGGFTSYFPLVEAWSHPVTAVHYTDDGYYSSIAWSGKPRRAPVRTTLEGTVLISRGRLDGQEKESGIAVGNIGSPDYVIGGSPP